TAANPRRPRSAFAVGGPHLRSPLPRFVDDLYKPLGRKLVRQPLHALAAGRPHLGDLWHGEGTEQRQTAHETERAGAPVGDQPCLLTNRAQTKEELRDLEHQVRDRLALAAGDPTP